MLGRKILRSGNAGVPSLSYYDLILVLLPVPLLVGLLAGKFLLVSLQMGVSVGAVLSAIGVGHVLFLNPPTRRGPGGRSSDPRGSANERSA